jgi:hypothetical protein
MRAERQSDLIECSQLGTDGACGANRLRTVVSTDTSRNGRKVLASLMATYQRMIRDVFEFESYSISNLMNEKSPGVHRPESNAHLGAGASEYQREACCRATVEEDA